MSVPARPAWTARGYRPGDERALVRLFEEVFHRPMTEEQWRWKLRSRPSPVENVGLAVTSDDAPIFQIAGIPRRLWLAGTERAAMVAVDAMTAPAFRRRGVLTEVARGLFERWRAGGLSLVLGLPNEQWGSRTAALGWQRLFPLQWLIRPLLPERLLARRLGLRALARARLLGRAWNAWWGRGTGAGAVEVAELERAGPDIDRLWTSSREGLGITLEHDASWVGWRYLAAPHQQHHVLLATRRDRPVGYAAYRVERDAERGFGLIPEIVTAPGDGAALRALLHATLARLQAADVETAATLAVPGTPLHRAFRRAGFVLSRGAFTVECVAFDPSISVADLRRPEGWNLVGGDFDVI